VFDHIVVFIHLVKLGSFSKTADFLNIAPSTLSRNIQELETYFGKILITRDTRNFSLTTNGETLYQTFKKLPSQLNNVKEIINPTRKTNNSTLNIALPVIHPLELITPYITYFNKMHPKVKLNLFYTTWGEITELKNKVDIAITMRPDTSRDFDQKFLRSEFVQLYCTPNYAIKYGLPITVDDILNHRIIGGIDHFNEIMNYPVFTNKYTGETFIYDSNKDNIKVNNIMHALKIGLNGEHIFPCWSYLCDELITKGELIQICPEYYALKTDLLLLTRKNSNREIQLFVDFIYRCMNKMIRIDNDLACVAE